MPDSSSSWLLYLLMVFAGLAGGVGDVMIYVWAKSDRPMWMLVAGVCWLVGLVLFGLAIKYGGQSLAAAFFIVTMLHVTIVVLIDLFWFGERLSRLEWLGAALAIGAVIALEVGREMRPTEKHPVAAPPGQAVDSGRVS